ncbi:PLD nuclease N-terminal domain-containing protein [Leifsonia sp. YAF41]|uniref:PLD nuclease N-terminal domain-containing protein n=1 Tax=Leifsonia sp. YAF41 TaxID=3233086 RepID=UPI003F9C267A
MARVWFILGLMVVILTVYTVVDCAMFDRSRVRGLPRWVWIFVILFIPVIGPLLWLIVGRGRRSAAGSRPTRSMAPDDDPDFLKGLAAQATQEQRIRQMEQELADLDKPDATDDGTPKGGAASNGSAGSAGAAGIPPKTTDPGDGEQPGRRDA